MTLAWSSPTPTATKWFFTSQDVNALHSKPADQRVFYGYDPLQFGDLRLPRSGSGPYPVAIIIHGGCWLAKYANLQNTAALADAFRDNGIATWNIEYRSVDNNGGGWPGTFLDVAHAADFLNNLAHKYPLDLKHVIVIGHSAGGHLALWLAGRHHLPPNSELYVKNPIKLQGAIVLGGVPDLLMFQKQGEIMCGTDVISRLLGNIPEQRLIHYRQASPNELLPLGVPQVLLYGENDLVTPSSFSYAYSQQAIKKGDVIKLAEIPYAGHHEYNVPNSVAWPTLQSAALLLLQH
ncbi:MAG: hypothetical protein A3E83_06300 [Gammaproteobacteria bacterium RIFCSPHIGHO2_12_FULL_41_20]|nr:MAG: hypothetical protein A3E83_06300 [Gammaproteobacteria bacterium RIFCSPHIGHO2_12_FULL_41_20]